MRGVPTLLRCMDERAALVCALRLLGATCDLLRATPALHDTTRPLGDCLSFDLDRMAAPLSAPG